jgi:hypothetical protein
MQYEIELVRVGDAEIVAGQLLPLNTQHLDDFDSACQAELSNSNDVDQYWDWENKKRIYLLNSLAICEGYAIEAENMTQGMINFQTRGYRSQIDPKRPIVYVHALATAPWNRISSPETYGFRAVGGNLLRFARLRSQELQYGGLVGLHSVSGSETFYRKMGMLDGGIDETKDDLTYFEWYYGDLPEE